MDIVKDHWNGYTYLYGDGERCIVSFDVTACDPAAPMALSRSVRRDAMRRSSWPVLRDRRCAIRS